MNEYHKKSLTSCSAVDVCIDPQVLIETPLGCEADGAAVNETLVANGEVADAAAANIALT